MGPSEEQLRAALRADGSTAPDVSAAPDADQIIGRALTERRARRRTVLSVAGAVVMVLAISGVVAGVKASGPGRTASALSTAVQGAVDSTDTQGAAGTPFIAGAPVTSTPPNPQRTQAGVQSDDAGSPVAPTCPAFWPAVAPVATGSEPTATQPLIDPTVTALAVCAYRVYDSVAAPLVNRFTLAGSDAQRLAANLNAQGPPANDIPCPAPGYGGLSVALLWLGSGRLHTVEAEPGPCNAFSDGVVTRAAGAVYAELAAQAEANIAATSTAKATHGAPIS